MNPWEHRSFFFFLSRSGWELLWRVVCVCCVDFLSGGERLGFKAPKRRGLGFGQCEDSSSVHLFCHPFFLFLLLLFIVMMMCFRCDLAPVVADRWWSGVGVHYPSESCRKKLWIGFATVEQMFFFVVHCHHHHGRRGNHDCGRCGKDSVFFLGQRKPGKVCLTQGFCLERKGGGGDGGGRRECK